MKIIFGVLLAIFSSVAGAATITLGPDACGTLKQCLDIPNDAGAAIALYGAPGYPWFYVFVDGVEYYAAVPSGYSMDSVSMQSFVLPDPTQPSVKQFTGSYLTISGAFTTYRTCTRSGRGQYCSTHWQFTGGRIER